MINTTDAGFKFNIEISKSGSDGISKMKIFCIGLALLEFCAECGLPIDFLVHDSEMYDGVDSRQRAAAIERASQVAEATGTNTIVHSTPTQCRMTTSAKGSPLTNTFASSWQTENPQGGFLGWVFDPPPKS